MIVFIKYTLQDKNFYWTGRGWTTLSSQAREYSKEVADSIIRKRFHRGKVARAPDGKLLQRVPVVTT